MVQVISDKKDESLDEQAHLRCLGFHQARDMMGVASHCTVDTPRVTIDPSVGMHEQSVLFIRIQGRSNPVIKGMSALGKRFIGVDTKLELIFSILLKCYIIEAGDIVILAMSVHRHLKVL